MSYVSYCLDRILLFYSSDSDYPMRYSRALFLYDTLGYTRMDKVSPHHSAHSHRYRSYHDSRIYRIASNFRRHTEHSRIYQSAKDTTHEHHESGWFIRRSLAHIITTRFIARTLYRSSNCRNSYSPHHPLTSHMDTPYGHSRFYSPL